MTNNQHKRRAIKNSKRQAKRNLTARQAQNNIWKEIRSNKPYTQKHSAVDANYAMVLVEPTHQYIFNTSVRYLDGVPENVGEFMRRKKTKSYQGILFNHPCHVVHKSYIDDLFEKYGVYQVIMIKAYRLLGLNPEKWSQSSSSVFVGKIIDEYLDLVKAQVETRESFGNSDRHAQNYKELFFRDKMKFGDVPRNLI